VREFPERRKTLNVFKEAARTWGSYDDFPVAPAGVDPGPHLSRNHVAQPFYLVTAQDEVLVTMSGEGEIRFKDPARTVLTVEPGDVAYLPARIPARIVPRGELVQVRLKGDPPFTEAAAWYCDNCDTLMHRVEFTAEFPQRSYWDAVAGYNADAQHRTCVACGLVHDKAELGDIAWNAVADALETANT
jgi:mannose-6-phosphate isomerase-like protein (cupin superfamily)